MIHPNGSPSAQHNSLSICYPSYINSGAPSRPFAFLPGRVPFVSRSFFQLQDLVQRSLLLYSCAWLPLLYRLHPNTLEKPQQLPGLTDDVCKAGHDFISARRPASIL